MKKVAVFLAEGFEEGEALFVVDVLRRAGFQCNLISINEEMVKGSHGIVVLADKIISDEIKEYDMIVLPGGLPGAKNLRDDERVIELVKYFDKVPEKFVAAICAAPMILEKAGIIKGRTVTSYPGEEYTTLLKDANYVEDIVVVDDHLITSRGPASVLPFAYTLVDVLGGNSSLLKQEMLYNMVRESQFE
ncbi:DJ-1 family glyoxalase III [Clostridium estertheticum]|uniref:DJ-1/PfpI family protein n=1 Tax=Clostridium estertheticum TaxID=238834 RepID=A0AA47EEY2_9CLOT|nr:DJ-1 family glyoxalase III [Clostridium estertheticum]MBU3156507.1 DJ-1/PfpI family protein [Clostridium estertheticum]MCB2353814.1 DJ-1/PfpI family protein [Clostridium estertheticum]WAG40486.1 DJ-1/PfpI family protein [Clostridium estertheticum]WAG58964.1 DJ-1/PfpI family protein [Clostridium estertheticum]